jgi:UDP-2,4-diacetamido-2,4,6-trideoxy-beta-L-altropyranose hydrolase
VRYSLILRNRRKWRHNFLTLGDNSLEIRRVGNGTVLKGAKYAMLRGEFLAMRGYHREYPDVAEKLLVTMGGADVHCTTLRVLEALDASQNIRFEVCMLVGVANPQHMEIVARAAAIDHQRIRVERHSDDMPELMAWADIAVTAGGTPFWELAFMSLPALLICLADNQRGGISAVCSAGAAGNLGDVQRINVDSLAYPLTRLACDKQGRERMGKAGGGLIDGLGSERVRKALEELT